MLSSVWVGPCRSPRDQNSTIIFPLHDIVRLAAAANPFQAHIWQQALQEEGIRCQVLGDYLDAGIGDIPGMTAEVWVESEDLARAEAILRQH